MIRPNSYETITKLLKQNYMMQGYLTLSTLII